MRCYTQLHLQSRAAKLGGSLLCEISSTTGIYTMAVLNVYNMHSHAGSACQNGRLTTAQHTVLTNMRRTPMLVTLNTLMMHMYLQLALSQLLRTHTHTPPHTCMMPWLLPITCAC
jgi:hypothetical protein